MVDIPQKGLKLPVIVTPLVTATYAWLDKEDQKYGGYKITCPMDPDEGEGRLEWGKKPVPTRDFIKHILAECKKYGVPSKPGEKGCPVKKRDDKEDFKGLLLLEPKSGFKPEQVDSTGKELVGNVSIRSGDQVKVAIQPTVREVNGNRYLSMYLQKVMLITKTAGEVDFGDTEGGYVAPQELSQEPETDFGPTEGTQSADF